MTITSQWISDLTEPQWLDSLSEDQWLDLAITPEALIPQGILNVRDRITTFVVQDRTLEFSSNDRLTTLVVKGV